MGDCLASVSSVQSVDRTFDIIEILAASSGGMLLTDLAAASNLHISTVHRLVSTLINRGYAYKNPDSGRYCLTLRFFEIGCQISGALDLITLSRPLLDHLSDFSQETVHLVKRDGNSVTYLYKSEPRQMLVRMASYVGGSGPMFCTGVGKAILSQLPEETVDAIWASSSVHKRTENTIIDLDELKKQLAQSRAAGYAVDNEENELGVCCVASAIYDWRGEPIGAVSISASKTRMTDAVKEHILPELLKTSAAISRQLGYTAPKKGA